MIRHLDSSYPDFETTLSSLIKFSKKDQLDVSEKVKRIIDEVQTGGDRSLVELTNLLDHRSVKGIEDLIVDQSMLEQAFDNLDLETAEALEFAANRIRRYHEQQLRSPT